MKISTNWMQQLSTAELMPAGGVQELVDKIGAQLGAVEEVIDLGQRYQKIVVAKVVTCEKIEDSDHLNFCTIDDGGITPDVNRGENGYVEVVCGAPNVKAGLTVAWLPPGSTVPSTFDKDPFVLEARPLRGHTSNGMLASPKELALSDSHEGILVLDDSLKAGTPLAEALDLNDTIIDIENKMFTHRPDCFGQLGVAREIAGIQGKAFTSPEWYLNPLAIESSNTLQLEVHNEIPELCPRYMAVAIDNIKVGPSPAWLQSYLSRVGVRPINNIVDMTNYMMLLTGQPLHAFDYDKVAKDGKVQIVVRKPREGEQMTLLDGKTITPRAEAILIADQEKPIALGGVMGGGNSEIDDNTTRIIIECANFDMYNIRRTSMEHGIFTDAVSRFNKGQSSWQCPAVLAKAVSLTQELSEGAAPTSQVVDVHQPARENKPVTLDVSFSNERLGLDLGAETAAQLLRNVEFEAVLNGTELQVTAPFWRTDIEIPEDVVEEIGRLYGFDKLPQTLPQRDLTPAVKDPMLELKAAVRASLSKAGANEVLTYSFVHGDLLDKVGEDKAEAFQLSNALSPDLQYFRLGLLPSLLDKVHANIKVGYDQFALFELGKGHAVSQKDEDGLPKEDELLSLVYAADDKLKLPGAAYYEARQFLDVLAKNFGLALEYGAAEDVTKLYDNNRAAVVSVNDQRLGVVGEFRGGVIKALKLPKRSAGFEIDLKVLQEYGHTSTAYVPLSRYPQVTQDISFKVPAGCNYQALYQLVREQLTNAAHDLLVDVQPLDIYQRPDDTDHKQITFRCSLASYEKTMTDQEVSALLDAVTNTAAQSFQAERI